MILLQILGLIILFVVVFFLATLVSVVFRFWGLIRQIFGKKGGKSDRTTHSSGQQTNTRSEYYSDHTTYGSSGTSQRKKIIPKDEGEYVDFEEV